MANPVLNKSLCSDWFLPSQDFAVRTVSVGTVQPVYFCFGAKSDFVFLVRSKQDQYCAWKDIRIMNGKLVFIKNELKIFHL